ncbi:hypothetical protein B0F90DRAFT_1817307 [Multifurca ochricompacta]|uniref:C2H2-type domain-containing protein n=1 Tax=Multifurca ochricompacta TaxID=376703 RepID=A0AAD4M4G4_9AGAM|nr:hypothetical protein B0F90DRAFT_1817307 [Multifurca ochricompacta]
MNYIETDLTALDSPHQSFSVPTPNRPPLYCPDSNCEKRFGRQQELNRHIIALHLPDWIYCPYSSCSWRGHRVEDFKDHLEKWNCGLLPTKEHYEIYNTKLVLSWISENGMSIYAVAWHALRFVEQKARELGKLEEWENLWG